MITAAPALTFAPDVLAQAFNSLIADSVFAVTLAVLALAALAMSRAQMSA